MKYLLSLLFLFSTQGFSGEIDGKTLICEWNINDFNPEVLDTTTNYDFKNGVVERYYIRTNYMISDYWGIKPATVKPNYITDANSIRWEGNVVNRKTLKMKFISKDTMVAKCEVVTFKEMMKRLKKRIYVLNKRLDKAREGNKI